LFLVPKDPADLCEAKQLAGLVGGKDGQKYPVRQGRNLGTGLNGPSSEYPAVDRSVANLTNGVDILSDLDDTIGGDFQTNFWSQLQLLWVSPGQLDAVLASIQSKVPA